MTRKLDLDNQMKNILERIDEIDLQNKIYYFDDVNFKYISDENLYSRIEDVIGKKEDILKIQQNIIIIPKDTILFRVRKLDRKYFKKILEDNSTFDSENKEMILNDLNSISFDEITIEKDLWNPPCERITTWGRINGPNESMLYLAINEKTAWVESNINEKDIFLLSRFLVKKDIKVNFIGELKEIGHNFSEANQRKLNLIDLFLKYQFNREVGKNKEYLYRISRMIAKNFFYIPEQEGWGYSSIADKEGYNICLEPEKIKKKLEFIDSRITVRLDDVNQCTYLLNLGVFLSDENMKLQYYPLNHEKVKYRFLDTICNKKVTFPHDYFQDI